MSTYIEVVKASEKPCQLEILQTFRKIYEDLRDPEIQAERRMQEYQHAYKDVYREETLGNRAQAPKHRELRRLAEKRLGLQALALETHKHALVAFLDLWIEEHSESD